MTLFVGDGDEWQVVAACIGDCVVCGADAFVQMGSLIEVEGHYRWVRGIFCGDHGPRDLVNA